MSQIVPVLVTIPFSPELLDGLRAVSPRLEIHSNPIRRDFPDDISPLAQGNEEIIFCVTPPRDLARVPNLKWVQVISAGIDHLHGHPIWQREITLTTTNGIHAVPISEFVFALMLALARKLPKIVRLQERAEWSRIRGDQLSGLELRGKTIGIVGYGSIGREIGRVAKFGFNMRVHAMRHGTNLPRRRYTEPGVGDPEAHIPDRWYPPPQLTDLMRESDFVVVAAPLTRETREMIGEEQLRAMKPHAMIINIARGELIDDRVLVTALKEGWIAGAGLDAFSVEPLPRGSQLWHMENVIVSPHVSGTTGKHDERACAVFAENLRRYLSGLPLLNVVSRDQEY